MPTPEELEVKRSALEEKRRLRKARRRKRALFYLLCVLIGVILLVGTAYWSYQNRRIPAGAESDADSGRVNILLLGADSGLTDGTRTDTMILVSVDKEEASVNAVAIPRDTRVHIPGYPGYDRINAAHAYGGPSLSVRTAENLLGVNIDYYVRLDYQGFETIVDTLGGVVIDVERPMHYVDEAQDLYIDLEPGVQLLTGKEALNYVRFRDGLGDVALVDQEKMEYGGRLQRQLKFARALANQAFSARSLVNAPELINQLRGAVSTNMPPAVALDLLMVAKNVESQDVHAAILPGRGQTIDGAAYWVVDEPLARELVNKYILDRPGMVRVAVLNGNGEDGLASYAADMLRSKGFEVVAVGNADRFDYDETSVIPLNGDPTLASQVAAALGWEEPVAAVDVFAGMNAADADVTVILGEDFHI